MMLSKDKNITAPKTCVFSNTLFENALSKNVRIMDEHGIHARPAAKIVAIAQNARSNVWIIKDNKKADAKSVIDILILSCQKGATVTVMVDDMPDAEILDDIVRLFEYGYED